MDDPIGYEYSRLAPQQLRLLKPVFPLDPDDLRFEIRHIPRGSAQRYTAVSYTWGDQEPTKTIRLNRKPFHDWIWVDAICINQQDDREKSEQVGLMDKIYSNAQMVSLWLGRVPVSDLRLHQGLSPSYGEPDDDQGSIFEDEPFEWYDHLQEVLNRPYWSRFWVIQEFLLARDIHYYCSSNITNSEHLHEMLAVEAEAYGSNSTMNEDFRMLLDSAVRNYAAASLILARKRDRFPEPELPPSLYDLLIRHRHAQCKDRRDRVFALLSLLGAEERGLLSRLLPNYSLSADQVVVIALAHMMNHHWIDHGEITADSDDIFQALGLEGGRAVRKRMLARAKQFGYYDDWTSVDIPRTMALQELLGTSYDTSDDNTDDLIDTGHSNRDLVDSANGSYRRSPVFGPLGLFAFLTVTGVLAARYMRPG